jgi:signal transduction protein with GAF and PtsI domain
LTNSASLQQSIQWELEKLKSEMELDFVAVAFSDGQYRDIYWRFALGAHSDQYKKIAVRMGRGMAGKVMQGMSPHIVTKFPDDVKEEIQEYPIFLVESLYSGMGVSINSDIHVHKQARGVLLVGHRSSRQFPLEDILTVQRCASRLAQWVDESNDTPENQTEYLQNSESMTTMEIGPILKLLHEAQATGIACELLDQRITRLTYERQEEIAIIVAFLLRGIAPASSTEASQLVIGHDESGQTLIEFEGYLLNTATQELFLPVMTQLKSLKCDLEIVIGKEKQSIRFFIPTRLLLDEMNWNN